MTAGLAARADDAAWEAFVAGRPEATPFHRIAWRAVAARLGHESLCLIARDGAEVRGVLPLFAVRRFGGAALVSVPGAAYAGILAADEAAREALAAAAVRLAGEHGAGEVELRTLEGRAPAGFETRSPCVRVVLDAAACAREALPKETRRHLRIARDAGLEIVRDPDVSDVHAPYLAASDRLGSPAFGEDFFAAIREAFGARATALVARKNGRAIASELWLTEGDRTFSTYGGATREGRDCRAGYALLDARLEEARASGIRTLDLGRSFRTSPSLEFKRAWGGREEDVFFVAHARSGRATAPPDPESPLFRIARACWRLVPGPMSRRLGPLLVRRIH